MRDLRSMPKRVGGKMDNLIEALCLILLEALDGVFAYSRELTFVDVVLFQVGLSEVGCLGGREGFKDEIKAYSKGFK
jgi:hypothetical protein